MERLTIKYEGLFTPKKACTIDRFGEADDCDSCDVICDSTHGSDCANCVIQECFTRLGEYENTGLTPAEIMELKERDTAKVLEGVLEEINKLKSECLSGKYGTGYKSGALDMANAIKDIIRKHLSRENDPEITRCSRDNDGWIPVERGLPEVFGKYWATIRYSDGRISEPIVADFRGVKRKYVVDTPNGREYETWGIDSAFHGGRVIAWRPYRIPEPYRTERSDNHDGE